MNPLIILPDDLYILKSEPENFDFLQTHNIFSLYYENFIYPFDSNLDVKITCKYGQNLKRCWRIEPLGDFEKAFPLTVSLYLYGEKLSEKTVTVHVCEKTDEKLSLLCIGDSMTQAETYISQAVRKATMIETIGTQCRTGLVKHEGRGGWKLERYAQMYYSSGGFYSPFLFPKNVSGKEYYGDLHYAQGVKNNPDHYTTAGATYEPLVKGEYALKDGKVCFFNGENFEIFDENPEYEFNFEKYLERNGFSVPDVVSFLFGANDLQITDYENTKTEIEKISGYLDMMVSDIRKCGSKIIICLPVLGADQYSWGIRMGCTGTAKQYEYNIKMWSKALIEKYGGRENEGIYICPMMATLDPLTGFEEGHSAASPYSNTYEYHKINWVHPCDIGYKLMGDTLAGVLCEIKNASL